MPVYQKIAVLFAALSVPIIILGLLCFESNMEDVFQWLPDRSPERTIYARFTENFGYDDFLVVSWEGCSVGDALCDDVADAIVDRDQHGLIESAISGRQLIAQLGDQTNLSPETIKRRFEGIYFGPDRLQTCIVVGLSKDGMNRRRDAVAHVQSACSDVAGDNSRIIVAGYPYVGAYSDELIRRSISRLVIPSCFLSTLVAWFCLKSLRLTLVALVASGLAALLSVAAITLTGGKWGGLSTAIPTLAYILTISGTLHLINYAKTCPREHLAMEILRIGYRPCLISALTTAAGMLSLCRSQFPAVRQFGLYTACGVLLALASQLILVPPALQYFNLAGRKLGSAWQDRLLEFDLRHHKRLLIAFALGGCALTVGLTQLDVDLEVERIFRPDAPVLRDIAWFEESLGPTEQTELVLTFDDTNTATFHQRVEIVHAIKTAVNKISIVGSTLALTDSFPRSSQRRGFRATVARVAHRSALRRARQRLAKTSYLSSLDDKETWRISLRVPFGQRVDFKRLSSDAVMCAQTISNRLPPDQRPEIWYTGGAHIYHVSQTRVVGDLFRNFALAFALICPLMVLAVRSFRLGILAMIPNIFPTAMVFGALGLIGYPLDIGMTMTACVALGIAVDDTTHFLVRFRDGQRLGSSLTSLQFAFRQCSTAMTQTTLIAGVGLAVLLLGPLLAMSRFAATLIALLFVALLCDLVLLPALLTTFRFVGKDEGRR